MRGKLLKLKELVVQPVLAYSTSQTRCNSWRNWGGIQTEEQAKAEQQRINEELQKLSNSKFKIKFLPVEPVKAVEKAKNPVKGDFDVLALYAGGWVISFEALTLPRSGMLCLYGMNRAQFILV